MKMGANKIVPPGGKGKDMPMPSDHDHGKGKGKDGEWARARTARAKARADHDIIMEHPGGENFYEIEDLVNERGHHRWRSDSSPSFLICMLISGKYFKDS